MSQNSSPANLREIGLKVTAPRVKVLEFFQQNPSSHFSAEEVYMAIVKEDSDIGLATVYRVLTQFEQAGILLRSHFESSKGDSRAIYELNEGQHHDHLVCLDCGHVEEFVDKHLRKTQAHGHLLLGLGHMTFANGFHTDHDSPLFQVDADQVGRVSNKNVVALSLAQLIKFMSGFIQTNPKIRIKTINGKCHPAIDSPNAKVAG
mgnify:CR=1 FL=1